MRRIILIHLKFRLKVKIFITAELYTGTSENFLYFTHRNRKLNIHAAESISNAAIPKYF